MNRVYYFFGDTPQRGIYNEEDGLIDYINSGALFIRDRFSPFSDKVFSNHKLMSQRNECLPLKLYKSIRASTKEDIKDDNMREYLQSHRENNVYRLQSKELVKYPATKESDTALEIGDDESRVVVVWTEKDKFEGIPPKAYCYVWIAIKELPDPDFLKILEGEKIIIVQGDTLRLNGAKISKGLSWEETALDTVWQYNQNKEIRNRLRFSRLLIVTYGLEGAVVLNPGDSQESEWNNRLFFYQTKMEGDIQSEYTGLIPEAFEIFVEQVINAIRNNFHYIETIINNMPEFLSVQATTHICGYSKKSRLIFDSFNLWNEPDISSCITSEYFSSVNIPDHSSWWSIPPDADMFRGNYSFLDNLDKLKEIINNGAVKANLNCPILCIGEFESVGRAEIESYSAIKNLLRKYIDTPFQGKPLSIAVFGQPGSGKSFGVKEIAKSIMGKEATFLEFNLSQYGDAQISTLYEAFHDIQDQTMNGKIPFVFFDEFDAQKLAWLKCFLMPMQDGEFIEHGRKRPLGKCIFVFAGGLYHSYAKLTEAVNNMKDAAIEKKIPDFLSRIKGYVNILGVNPEIIHEDQSTDHPKDQLYIIKRAMMLSSMLKRLGKRTNTNINLSEDVLRAFLYTKTFKNGARSMEAILEMSFVPPNNTLEISDMPARTQLELHVDSTDFNSHLHRRITRDELVGRIARKYALLDQRYWECIFSQEQNRYYSRAENLLDYIIWDLNLSIRLCGDTGRIDGKSERKPLLLSDHGQYKKIDDEQLDSLILRSKYYLGHNGRIEMQIPDDPERCKEYMANIRNEVLWMLKPFDVDPENTGFYLFDR